MFKAIKGVSSKLSNRSKESKEAESEAVALIEKQLNYLLEQLEHLPDDRLPSPKVAKIVPNLIQDVTEILAKGDLELADLSAARQIDEIDDERKKLTFGRFLTLIPASKALTPFATFNELEKVATEEDKERNLDLKDGYLNAMNELYTHPSFAESILVDTQKIAIMLKKTAYQEPTAERHRVSQFIESFYSFVHLSPTVAKDPTVEPAIQEVESTIFLQDQTYILSLGETVPTKDLEDYIKHWVSYLDGLSAEGQASREVLIDAVNQCSLMYNEVLKVLREVGVESA